MVICGISQSFDWLSPTLRQITHALLTRAPLGIATSFDLHVLGTPPAFVLSQNQTLQLKILSTKNKSLAKNSVRIIESIVFGYTIYKKTIRLKFTSYSDFKEHIFRFERQRFKSISFPRQHLFSFFFFSLRIGNHFKSCSNLAHIFFGYKNLI